MTASDTSPRKSGRGVFTALHRPNRLLTITGARLGPSRCSGMAPVRIVRAFRLPIIVAMTGLVLSGCMRTGGRSRSCSRRAISIPWPMARPTRRPPSAVADPRAAAPSARSAPPLPPRLVRPMRAPVRARGLCGAGRGGALRRRLSSRRRRQAARGGLRPGRSHQYLCDRCQRLDHHAADRRRARARTHHLRPRRRDRAQNCATVLSASPRSPSRSRPIAPSSSLARSQLPDNIPMCPT